MKKLMNNWWVRFIIDGLTAVIVVAGLLFVLLAIPTIRVADRISKRFTAREQQGVML